MLFSARHVAHSGSEWAFLACVAACAPDRAGQHAAAACLPSALPVQRRRRPLRTPDAGHATAFTTACSLQQPPLPAAQAHGRPPSSPTPAISNRRRRRFAPVPTRPHPSAPPTAPSPPPAPSASSSRPLRIQAPRGAAARRSAKSSLGTGPSGGHAVARRCEVDGDLRRQAEVQGFSGSGSVGGGQQT